MAASSSPFARRHPSPLASSAALALAVTALLAAPAAHAVPDGFYFSLGLGGGLTLSGEQGVTMKVPSACGGGGVPRPFLWYEPADHQCVFALSDAQHKEVARTDWGSGLGFQLRIGYNILGHASVEATVSGQGNPDGSEGAGHVSFQARWGFAELITPHEARDWDADVFFGGGYSIGGYHPDPAVQGNDDGKGWDGYNFTFGGAFRYAVAKRITLDLDLKFILPGYTTFIANFDKGYEATPAQTPSTLVFSPTLGVTFFLQ